MLHFQCKMGILSVNFSDINLEDVIFDGNDLKLLFMLDLWLDVIDLNNVKHLKNI